MGRARCHAIVRKTRRLHRLHFLQTDPHRLGPVNRRSGKSTRHPDRERDLLRFALSYHDPASEKGLRRRAHVTLNRTRVVKGLEFDHSVIAETSPFDKKDWYLALTRASVRVRIVSASKQLMP